MEIYYVFFNGEGGTNYYYTVGTSWEEIFLDFVEEKNFTGKEQFFFHDWLDLWPSSAKPISLILILNLQ